jgi:hypothetical protein
MFLVVDSLRLFLSVVPCGGFLAVVSLCCSLWLFLVVDSLRWIPCGCFLWWIPCGSFSGPLWWIPCGCFLWWIPCGGFLVVVLVVPCGGFLVVVSLCCTTSRWARCLLQTDYPTPPREPTNFQGTLFSVLLYTNSISDD